MKTSKKDIVSEAKRIMLHARKIGKKLSRKKALQLSKNLFIALDKHIEVK